MRLVAGLTAVVLFAASGAWAAPALAPADIAAAFEAAGFKRKGGEWVRCEDTQTASRQSGALEVADLNGDDAPEAWVRESSLFCYGNTAEAFVLLTKRGSTWMVLLDEVGVAVPRPTKTRGWPDIEVGGPGLGAMPVYRFDGAKYARAVAARP
jgi:hypothetical protein